MARTFPAAVAVVLAVAGLAAVSGCNQATSGQVVERASMKTGAEQNSCIEAGQWMAPMGRVVLSPDRAIARLAAADIVILGESHVSREHHRWQLHTLAALHARRPDMVIGLEMFPREVQWVLDRWSRGEYDEPEFLLRSRWEQVWGYDASLYMPIFHFARQNRIPMVALNVNRSLPSEVRQKGWAEIPSARREGVGDPAAPSAAYSDSLRDTFSFHARGEDGTVDEQDFGRFVEAQLTWDRAMAEGLAEAAANPPKPLVVGIIGSGHLVYGHGVPHQLRDLGVSKVEVAIPWDVGAPCAELRPDLADLVFALEPDAEAKAAAAQRPVLGVRIEDAGGRVRVAGVAEDSVAVDAGIQEGDVIRAAAGSPVSSNEDLIAIVRRQAPGTWLPIEVERGGKEFFLVAKFPPAPAPEPERN